MQSVPDAWVQRVNQEFETWERLRRELTEREGCWAAAVTANADARRLAALERELAQLRRALDEVFRRAMGAVEQAAAGAPAG